MNIEDIWKKENAGGDDLERFLNQNDIIRHQPGNPLAKIKKNLAISSMWGLPLITFYIVVMLYYPLWQVQLSLMAGLIFTIWVMYTAYKHYRQINNAVSDHNNVLNEMERHYYNISKWIDIQQKAALFIYPIAAAGGFMLGGYIGSGKPIDVFMHKPVVIISCLVSIVVLSPACYFLARWMNNIAFGKHLKHLKENIDALKGD